MPAALEPGPLMHVVRKRTVAKVLSMGFVLRRGTQRSAVYAKYASSTSASSVIVATAFGYFAP